MFYSITGTVAHKDPAFAVLQAGGVAFKISTSLTTLSSIGARGEEATLYTYLHVREDIMDLYGFASLAELNIFKLLISVSGVGPKAAISILSDMSPERFAIAVAGDDVKAIRQAPGIGPKIAQRIVLELKDKLKDRLKDVAVAGVIGPAEVLDKDMGNTSEALSALMVLGYSHGEAAGALAGLSPDLSVEDMIKESLKKLASW